MSRGPASWKSSDVAWRGGKRPYDLLREVITSSLIVGVAVVALSLVFASPDPRPVTFREWAEQGPGDFVATTLAEVTATSSSATYGPPYQTTAQNGSTQELGPLSPERWFGERIPVDTFEDFVARPLRTLPDPNGEVAAALERWRTASASDQQAWTTAATAAITAATFANGSWDVDPSGTGPLGTILEAQYAFARSGGLDAAILANPERTLWYSNDQTFALLYLGDSGEGGSGTDCISPGGTLPADGGCWYYNQSVANVAPRFSGYLSGGTWGVINEVGNWPGAWWLFPYSFWYQWGYGASGSAGDLYAMLMTGLVSLPFLFLPWIPGLRDLPRLLGVYKVMWGDYYRLVRHERAGARDGEA